jgi:uncharacterized membrane protein
MTRRPIPLPLHAARLAALALVGLCACGDDGGEGKDSPLPADTGACADAPVLTWANFGAGFLIENCQSCHASTSPDRNGAPESVTFDTEAEALALQDRILIRAAGDAPDMPPEGGITEEDRHRLELWLTCWVE